MSKSKNKRMESVKGPMISTSKGEGPQWYGGPGGKDYDIKWLKKERSYHPDAHYVDEYENKYGKIL